MAKVKHKIRKFKGMANRPVKGKVDPETWSVDTINVTVRRDGSFETRPGYKKISAVKPGTGPVRIGGQIRDTFYVLINGTWYKTTISTAVY